jgi:Mg2+-importing ATPase
MLPLQLLLLNLIYDFSCIAIPFDNVDKDYLQKPRKWDASSLGRFMLWMGPTSSIFDWLTYAVMFFVICPLYAGGKWGSAECDSALFIALFQTGWFVESMASQSLVIHMIRSDKIPLFQSRSSWQLFLATGLAVALAIALPFIPGVSTSLGLAPLPAMYFAYLALAILLYMLLATFAKNLYKRRFGEVL